MKQIVTLSHALICAAAISAYAPLAHAHGENSTRGTGAIYNAVSGSITPGWGMEKTYWRMHSSDYRTYKHAYKYGAMTYNLHTGGRYENLDMDDLRRGWMVARGNSGLSWSEAEPAIRDAYNHRYDNDHMNWFRRSRT